MIQLASKFGWASFQPQPRTKMVAWVIVILAFSEMESFIVKLVCGLDGCLSIVMGVTVPTDEPSYAFDSDHSVNSHTNTTHILCARGSVRHHHSRLGSIVE